MKRTLISQKEVEHIARLANLPLTSAEVAKFTKQLGETLEAISRISELKTSGIIPTSQVTGLENVKREDKKTGQQSLSQEEALKNAARKARGMFLVDAIFEEQ